MKEYGEAKFQVHSFLTFALDYIRQPEALATLPPYPQLNPLNKGQGRLHSRFGNNIHLCFLPPPGIEPRFFKHSILSLVIFKRYTKSKFYLKIEFLTHREHFVTIKMSSRLLPSEELITGCCEQRKKYLIAFWARKFGFCILNMTAEIGRAHV
jgi:hypothetical protein